MVSKMKKIDQEKKVSNETKNKIQIVKVTTGAVYDFTHEQVFKRNIIAKIDFKNGSHRWR